MAEREGTPQERKPGQPGAPPSASHASGRPPAVPAEPVRTVTRTDLEAIILRAAELSMRDADADERVSEQDLVRIADELGLPARHVWQAIYERPTMTAPPMLGGKRFGSPIIVASRVVPGDVALTRRRLEDYLVTQEYLSVARRSPDELRLLPADDTLSSVARVFARPRRRHHLAHARRVLVATHALPGGEAAVRLEVDLSEHRRKERQNAAVAGAFAGMGGFAAGALIGDAIVPGAGSQAAALVGGVVVAAPAALGAFAAVARSFRRKVTEARLELESLLDRLETGERLEPPPAPWRRRLGLRLFGSR